MNFDATTAFNDAFDTELGEYPPGTEFRASGRVTKANPNGEDEGWWREYGPQWVENWVKFRATMPWTTWVTPDGRPAIELELEERVGGVLFKMVIDRVMDAGGKLGVVDLKSGASYPVDRLQLGMYKAAIETRWPEVRISWGTYWRARSPETVDIYPLNRYTPEYVGALGRRLKLARSAGIFLPNVGPHCKACGVARFCAINGGAESHFDPDYVLMGG